MEHYVNCVFEKHFERITWALGRPWESQGSVVDQAIKPRRACAERVLSPYEQVKFRTHTPVPKARFVHSTPLQKTPVRAGRGTPFLGTYVTT